MNPENPLDYPTIRNVLAFDLETYLIGASLTAPPVVCVSWANLYLPDTGPPDWASECARVTAAATDLRTGALYTRRPGLTWDVFDPYHGAEVVRAALESADTLVVGHNVAFDLWCLGQDYPAMVPAIQAALAAGRVQCTQVRDQLIDIARGQFRSREEIDDETGEVIFRAVGYHLTELTARRLGFALEKGEDTWRLRYGELAATPVAQWAREPVQYAALDALSALAVWTSQRAEWHPIPDETRQTQAAYALAGVAGRGICVDPPAVDALAEHVASEVEGVRAHLASAGLYRPDGTKDLGALRERVSAAYQSRGLTTPATNKGAVATSRQVLLDSGDPVLRQLAAAGASERVLTGFIPVLRGGYQSPIVCRYHTLVDTGRTSCVGPNLQQLPRYPGVRDCFVPRPGYLFVSVDYDAIELRALAQVCLDTVGYSTMANKWREDASFDPHAWFAASMLGVTSYQLRERLKSPDPEIRAAAKLARQRAKAANFGFPGGLGVPKFRDYARTTYGVDLSEGEAWELRQAWRGQWPEVPEYQAVIAGALGPDGLGTFALVQTGFVRGDCRYTQACNTQFQGLAAAGAKAALFRAIVEGPAHGVFPVAFLHDEILAEVPIDTAHNSAYWLASTMCAAMAQVIPGVPISASPALMARWYKSAETVLDASGQLVPWTPPPPQSKPAL